MELGRKGESQSLSIYGDAPHETTHVCIEMKENFIIPNEKELKTNCIPWTSNYCFANYKKKLLFH